MGEKERKLERWNRVINQHLSGPYFDKIYKEEAFWDKCIIFNVASKSLLVFLEADKSCGKEEHATGKRLPLAHRMAFSCPDKKAMYSSCF